MMKSLRMKTLLLLGLLLGGVGSMLADTYTLGWGDATGTDGTYTNFTATSGNVEGILSFSTEKNSSGTVPAYNSNSKELRLYYASNGNGGSITITPAIGVTITKAVMATSLFPKVAYSVDGGTATEVKDYNQTYTISGIEAKTSLKIQNVNTENTQLRISTIEITYTIGEVTTYNVNFNVGDGTFVGSDDFPKASNNVKVAGTYTLPSADAPTFYGFDGWLAAGSNTPVTGEYNLSDNVNFTALYSYSGQLTFDLSSNPDSWPTTNPTNLTDCTYKLDGVDYTFALKNVKCNPGYLMMTVPAVLGLPAIEGHKLTKVVAYNSGGCSTSTNVGISSSASSETYVGGGNAKTWSTTSSSYTYELTSTAPNTMYYMYVTNKNAQVTKLDLYYAEDRTVSITANDVEIADIATSGVVEYSIINEPNPAGTLTAAIADGATIENLTLGAIENGTVSFTCSANTSTTERTATVTLNYAYGNDLATKDVIITQAAGPFTLTVSQLENVEMYVSAGEESETLFEGTGSGNVYSGTNVMLSVSATEGEILSLIVDGKDVTTKITDSGVYSFEMPSHNVTITAKAGQFEPVTYTLANSITSGKTYIIVNQESAKAMGEQNTNNRAAVGVTLDNNEITVESSDVYEFVITYLGNNLYSIYDAKEGGYLYAASSNNNYLRTKAELDNNCKWTIEINGNVASIVAQGANMRNVMQYNNNGNTLFSCYAASAPQKPVYLYEKKDEPAITSVEITMNQFGVMTYAYDKPLDFSNVEGLTAYAATGINGSSLTMEKVKQAAAAEGLMLEGTPNTTYTVPVSSTTPNEASDNMLVGLTVAMPVKQVENGYTTFILANGNDGVNWYKLEETSYTLKANSAYLRLTEDQVSQLGQGTRGLTMVYGSDSDGIESISREATTYLYFDLSGRRVENPTKGLYIVNGKKVNVK